MAGSRRRGRRRPKPGSRCTRGAGVFCPMCSRRPRLGTRSSAAWRSSCGRPASRGRRWPCCDMPSAPSTSPSALRRRHDGRGARRGIGERALQHVAAHAAGCGGAGAGCRRDLRRDRVPRDAAYARDRASSGPGRDTGVHAVLRLAPRRGACRVRACARAAGAFAATRVLATLLFEVQPTDPPTFSRPAAILLVALIACVAPAVRAIRISPVRALTEV